MISGMIFFAATFDEPPTDLPPPPPESPPPESENEDSKSIDEEVKVEVTPVQEVENPRSPPEEYVFKYDPELQTFEASNSEPTDQEIEVAKEEEKPEDHQDAPPADEPVKKDSIKSEDFHFTMGSHDEPIKTEEVKVHDEIKVDEEVKAEPENKVEQEVKAEVESVEKDLDKPAENATISRMKSHEHFASIEEPLEDDAKSNDASSEKEDESNETIASMQEKLKRELTVKRKDEDELPALPVREEPAVAAKAPKKKSEKSSCCTIV